MQDGNHRFSAFFGPGHDWTPDFNWGGSGCLQLQEMLVQEYNGRIYLLPAWPVGEAVEFKLNVEGNGWVKCKYDGKDIVLIEADSKATRSKIVGIEV